MSVTTTVVVTKTVETAVEMGAIGGPVGVAVAVGVGVGILGLTWLLTESSSSSSSNGSASKTPPASAPPPQQKQQRKASVGYQMGQQQGGSGQSSGNGEDPNWRNVQRPGESLTDLRIFERIVLEILERLQRGGLSTTSRLHLLRLLRDALAKLLQLQPDIVVEITAERELRLRGVGLGVVTLPRTLIELFDLQDVADLGMGVGETTTPFVYRIRCCFCNGNYVGQSVNPSGQRRSSHESSMATRIASCSLYKHHKEKGCCRYGCKCLFEGNYEFSVIMVVVGCGLRQAEVFWQWLMCGREKDGGIGRR